MRTFPSNFLTHQCLTGAVKGFQNPSSLCSSLAVPVTKYSLLLFHEKILFKAKGSSLRIFYNLQVFSMLQGIIQSLKTVEKASNEGNCYQFNQLLELCFITFPFRYTAPK